MNRLSKALAPAVVVALLGGSVSPAFAGTGATIEETQNINVYTAEATLPATVNTPDAPVTIPTLADATAMAESLKEDSAVVKVSEEAVLDIENALNAKFQVKLDDKAKAAKAKADRIAKEKAVKDAKVKAEKEAKEKKAAAKAKADRIAKEKAAEVTEAEIVDEQGTIDTQGVEEIEAQDTYTAPASPESDSYATTWTAPAQTADAVWTAPQSGTVKESPAKKSNSSAPKSNASKNVKPASSTNQKIYQAAMAQLGNKQDCTMLVTNALKSVGINFRDWPAGYKKLGTVIPASQAQPGDLIYYRDGGMGLAHIAVYAGGGKAIHGGWNGNDTVINSANVGSGVEYIRVNA